MKNIRLVMAVLAASATFYGCFKNPVTGRKSVNLVSESEMRQMSAQEYAKALAANPPQQGTVDAQMVQRVGNKMADAVAKYLKDKGQADVIAGYQWEFNLLNSSEVNAWCMPGGKVAVYTGILPFTQTETGLAVVMGHEIAHAIAKHGNERASEQLIAQYGAQTLAGVMSDNPTTATKVFNTAVGVGGQLTLLKFSRGQESEADEMGLIFMAIAGYNPNEAVEFWSRMSAQGGAKPPEILSTHPSDATRIADIRKLIPKAMQYYKPQ